MTSKKNAVINDAQVNNLLLSISGGEKGGRGKENKLKILYENPDKPNKSNKTDKKITKKNIESDDEKNYTKPNSNYVKNGYVRPKTTFTDNLTPDKIEELLEDYGEKPIEEIPLGTHVRYFVKDNGESKFRIGGFLNDINGLPDYVRLRAGPNMENTWNVQVKNAIFYKKLSIKEIKQEYDKIVDDYIEKIKKLKSKIKDYEKTYKIK